MMEDYIKSFKTHPFWHTFAWPYTCFFFLEKPKLSSVFVFFGASVAPMRQFCPLLKKRKTMYKFRKKQSALVLIWPTDDSWHTRREKCALNPVIPKILPKFPQVMEFWELSSVISGNIISIWAYKNKFKLCQSWNSPIPLMAHIFYYSSYNKTL